MINRRNLLASLPPLAALPFLRLAAQEKRSGPVTIRDVEIWQFTGHRKPDDLKMQWQVGPASIYRAEVPSIPATHKPAAAGPTSILQEAHYLKILTREGIEGFYGMIDRESAIVIDRQVGPPQSGVGALKNLFPATRFSRTILLWWGTSPEVDIMYKVLCGASLKIRISPQKWRGSVKNLLR